MRDTRRTSSKAKMKIILCLFELCITAVCVFGQSMDLSGVLGKSVTFPTAVEKGGSLMSRGKVIADVNNGKMEPPPDKKYKDRLQWDSSTGLFSLSELERTDSGEYKVTNAGKPDIKYNLMLYVPVSKPHVNITGDEYPCTLLCTLERGTDATLSWYREAEKKPFVSSSVRNVPHLDLPVPVERSGTYTCEAKNSVNSENASIKVEFECTGGAAGIWKIEGSKMWSMCLVLIVILDSPLV